MKILHITIYPPRGQSHGYAGGVAPYTKNLITNMPIGVDDIVFVLCNKIEGKYEKYKEDNVNIIRCFDKKPKFVWQLLKEVKKINPDIIHVQQELGLFGGILTAYLLQWLLFLLCGYKLVVTLHGVVSLKKIDSNFIKKNRTNLPVWLVNLGFYVIYKPLCMWSRKNIVHEQYFKDILANEYKVKRSKIKIIHLGVENLKTISTEEARQKLNLDLRKNIILYMGYLTSYKGLDLLIEGFSKYAKIDPSAFLIIGAGQHPKFKEDRKYLLEYQRIQDKAKKLIDKNQYRWVGFIKEQEIVYYYSASDVSIYPYTILISSSAPMAFAIGYEKPFLASDEFARVIGNPKIIFRKTPGHLTQKLKEFFLNKEKSKNDIKNVVRIIKKERLWSKISEETYSLYLSIK